MTSVYIYMVDEWIVDEWMVDDRVNKRIIVFFLLNKYERKRKKGLQ